MTDLTQQEVSDFIHRYSVYAQEQETKGVEVFKREFDRLKVGFTKVRLQTIKEARENAPLFNVFAILGLSRYEERTHSAMIANLLDPMGRHGQQHLFLHRFITYCASKYPDFPTPSGKVEEAQWQITQELSTNYGRLDIVIRSPELGYLCVIENKVDASEQEDQLLRYGQWLETRMDDYPDQALIYLTPTGEKAYTAGQFGYFKLSYRQDISSWLEVAMPVIQAERVRIVLQQYHDLVSNL